MVGGCVCDKALRLVETTLEILIIWVSRTGSQKDEKQAGWGGVEDDSCSYVSVN